MVLGGRQGQGRQAVAQHHEAGLLPIQELLNHHPRPALVVHHHVYDRAILSSLVRKRKALRMARTLREDAILLEGEARLRVLLSLVTSAGCVLHDSHNALKWAALQRITEPDTVRHLFVCIGSVRQGFDELVVHLPGWSVSVLQYEDGAASSSWPELWKLCSVPHAIHDVLVD